MIPSRAAESYENDDPYAEIQSLDQFISMFSNELNQKESISAQNTTKNAFSDGPGQFAFSTDKFNHTTVYDEELSSVVKSILGDQFSQDQIQRLSNSLSEILDDSFQQTADLYRPKRAKRYPNNFPIPSIGFILPQPQVMVNSEQMNSPYQGQFTKPFQIQNPLQMNSMQNIYLMQSILQNNSVKNQLPINGYFYQNPFQMNGYSIQNKSSKKDKKKNKKSKKEKDVTKCDGGIFRFLFDKYKQSPIDKGVVFISSQMMDSSNENKNLLKNIIDPNSNSKYWKSRNCENSFFEITFKNMLVSVKKYHLKLGFQIGKYVFNSWILTGTNKDGKQVTLDEVDETDSISDSKPEATFEVKKKSYVKSLRLTMSKLRNIELFGNIKFTGE